MSYITKKIEDLIQHGTNGNGLLFPITEEHALKHRGIGKTVLAELKRRGLVSLSLDITDITNGLQPVNATLLKNIVKYDVQDIQITIHPKQSPRIDHIRGKALPKTRGPFPLPNSQETLKELINFFNVSITNTSEDIPSNSRAYTTQGELHVLSCKCTRHQVDRDKYTLNIGVARTN